MLELPTLAAIIQGEAGILGWDGMYEVARCIAAQIESGWTPAEIETAWHGRKQPGGLALLLADMVSSGMLVGGQYKFCLSLEDTKTLKVRPGDFCVSKKIHGHLYEIHLYREWPVSDAAE